MLNEQFFYIENIDADTNKDSLIVEIVLNPLHEIFQGHFPENPIVPGVCFIQMITEIFSAFIKKDLRLIKSNSIKYQHFVDPRLNSKLYFEIKYNSIDKIHYGVICRIYFEQINFCNFKGEFEDVCKYN